MMYVILAAAISAPNVVFLSVDTLRADRLGFYGYEFNTSPHLDELAKRALVFDDVVCEIPLTGPSFCAMMSSQFPRVTGATRNGLRLPDEFPTVAEPFQSAGYHTICVQSNWTLKSKLSGLDRGFDVYQDEFHKRRWGLIKSERDAAEVTRTGIELLEKWDRSKPLFAWFHYSDPHAPYKLRRKFNVAAEDETTGRNARVSRKYDSEIAYTDYHIGLLLEALPKDNTFIVFVGDHGESLYEHDYLGHGRRIYQTCLHIPLFIRGPGIVPGRTDAPARGLDVGPTLLALAGLPPLEGALGTNLASGRLPADRIRVVETYGGAVLHVPGIKSLMANSDAQRQGVIFQGWKAIVNGDDAELFDLRTDPRELNDVAREHPDRVANLTALIRAWDHEVSRMTSEGVQLSDDDVRALKSLGYVE